jgi:hypothetical protein
VVKVGPFTGHIAPQYDVVGGRFRLHVGSFRDKAIGLSQKIPWYARPGSAVGRSLVITGTRLTPRPVRSFKQEFRAAGRVFPTIISPPSAGCWRLVFTSGSVTSTLKVLVTRPGS